MRQKKPRPLRLDREIPILTAKKPLPPSQERRAILWFGDLRKLLMDPSLGEGQPDDLFCRPSAQDFQNHRRLFPRVVGKRRPNRKERKRPIVES